MIINKKGSKFEKNMKGFFDQIELLVCGFKFQKNIFFFQ